jgi:hypothetical protein
MKFLKKIVDQQVLFFYLKTSDPQKLHAPILSQKCWSFVGSKVKGESRLYIRSKQEINTKNLKFAGTKPRVVL